MQLGFQDVAVIADLDYLFSNDIVYLLKELGIDTQYPAKLRAHIGWAEGGDPSLDTVIAALETKGRPDILTEVQTYLEAARIFVLKRGAPETYYVAAGGKKGGWLDVKTESDLVDAAELKALMTNVLKG